MLRAVGLAVDSLIITLSVVTSGDTVLLEDWRSSYQLIDPPEQAVAVGPGRDAYVRNALDSSLAGVRIESFNDSTLSQSWIPNSSDYDCDSNVHDCIVKAVRTELAPKGWTRAQVFAAPFDTARARAVVEDVRRNATKQVTLAYGYETVVSYVWSPLARKFYTVFECC